MLRDCWSLMLSISSTAFVQHVLVVRCSYPVNETFQLVDCRLYTWPSETLICRFMTMWICLVIGQRRWRYQWRADRFEMGLYLPLTRFILMANQISVNMTITQGNEIEEIEAKFGGRFLFTFVVFSLFRKLHSFIARLEERLHKLAFVRNHSVYGFHYRLLSPFG